MEQNFVALYVGSHLILITSSSIMSGLNTLSMNTIPGRTSRKLVPMTWSFAKFAHNTPQFMRKMPTHYGHTMVREIIPSWLGDSWFLALIVDKRLEDFNHM